MRLVRRTILCLIVGVAAFGAAGWMLRPRPNWTCSLGHNLQVMFIHGVRPQSSDEPIWLLVNNREGEGEGSEFCVDGRTGKIVQKIVNLEGEDRALMRLIDGRLFLRASKTPSGAADPMSRLEVYSHTQSKPVVSREATGKWNASPNGRFVWKKTSLTEGVDVEVAELESGNAVGRKTIHGGGQFNDGVLSDDCKFAVYFGDYQDFNRPHGIEVWDLKSGKRLYRQPFPPSSSTELRASPLFRSATAAAVDSFWYETKRDGATHRYFTVNFDSGELTDVPCKLIERPPNDGEAAVIPSYPQVRDGYEVWTSESTAPHSAFWCIQHAGESISSWRSFRYVPATKPMLTIPGRKTRGTMTVEFIKAPDTLLVRTFEPPLVDSIPGVFRKYLPGSWRGEEPRSRYHWFDWRRNDRREIGCDSRSYSLAFHGDSMLTVHSDVDDEAILQSWPLPPRDPKWPALLIAIACAGGTWRLCDWRYRRRLKRAMNAAETV
jgi:hypothetical protein